MHRHKVESIWMSNLAFKAYHIYISNRLHTKNNLVHISELKNYPTLIWKVTNENYTFLLMHSTMEIGTYYLLVGISLWKNTFSIEKDRVASLKYHGLKNPQKLGPHERIQQKSNYDIAE